MGAKPNWTTEEKQYLEEYWGTYSIGTLAERLNRSENGILNMKARMKLGPFLERGEYVTFNQFMKAIGTRSDTYKTISWVERRGFPVHTKRVNNCSFKVVYLDEFWEWADKNRCFYDWSKMEENVLGEEPEWLKTLRRHKQQVRQMYKISKWTASEDKTLRILVSSGKHTVDDISRRLGRTCGAIQRRLNDLGITERPVKAYNGNKYTADELHLLFSMVEERTPYEIMADRLGRSTKAIRGIVYRYCGTENLDRAAAAMAEERGAQRWIA